MKKYFLHIGIITVFISAFSKCANKEKRNTFYASKGASWDASRIPLIEPYEMINLNGNDDWNVNLVGSPGSVSNIKEINVHSGIILIHTKECFCNNEKLDETWFVIQAAEHIERCFATNEKFLKYLHSLNQDSCKLYSIDTVIAKFVASKSTIWPQKFN